MDLLVHLALGFGVVFSPENLLYCLIGALLGTLIGVLPGIGPLAALAMLLPLTFHLPATGSLIMLAGIYYGAQYGGSTTSILLNMPGESSSVVTAIDGHQMARQGRAGAALATAALGSFFAGSVATLTIAVIATPLANVGARFGSPEFFSLMVLGLVGAVVLAQGSVVKAIAMIIFGLLLGLVGSDMYTGTPRFTLGIPQLYDGLDFVPVALGLFGLGEIIANLSSAGQGERQVKSEKISGLWLTKAEFKAAWPASVRGTVIGSILGILPGGGALLSSFASYIVEKKLAKDPSRFGKGAIEGVAGPESANNAGAQNSFIPMLTLGIPSNTLMALMMGAMMIQGITPGPQVITSHPDLFWGLIASMWVGNAMLLVINLPLIGIWVSLLKIPYRMLFPAILLFCAIGVYSVNFSPFDIMLAAGFGVLGYFFRKVGCETAPLMLGLVLGPLMEENLRRSMQLSRGDFSIFLTRPISLVLLLATAGLLLILIMPTIRKGREEAFQED
ncbi:MAG TPA: tripartite tricarboxylate transporter permease [Devosiaceae bacterium]|jgi:TctA family transporter